MSTLSREHRRIARKDSRASTHYSRRWCPQGSAGSVGRAPPRAVAAYDADDRKLRNQLRAHGRQLGDRRDAQSETQEIEHLVQACAYEHWHRMLFARFLAENDLLLDTRAWRGDDAGRVRELAREQGRDWMDVAAEFAAAHVARRLSSGRPGAARCTCRRKRARSLKRSCLIAAGSLPQPTTASAGSISSGSRMRRTG